MADHYWAILCRRLLIDQHTNQASLIDVIEEISIAGESLEEGEDWKMLPFEGAIVCSLGSSVKDTNEECTLSITPIAPNGNEFHSISRSFIIEGGRVRVFAEMHSLPFCIEGEYFFRIDLTDSKGTREVARVPLTLHFISQEKFVQIQQAGDSWQE